MPVEMKLYNYTVRHLDFRNNIKKNETINLLIEKSGRCVFSVDKSLKRALVIIKITAKTEDENKYNFAIESEVEVQLNEMPDDDQKAEITRKDIVPFADKIVVDKVKEMSGFFGQNELDLTT